MLAWRSPAVLVPIPGTDKSGILRERNRKSTPKVADMFEHCRAQRTDPTTLTADRQSQGGTIVRVGRYRPPGLFFCVARTRRSRNTAAFPTTARSRSETRAASPRRRSAGQCSRPSDSAAAETTARPSPARMGTTGIGLVENHPMIEVLVDPGTHFPLDVGEIEDHAALVQGLRTDRNDGPPVVPVQMAAFSRIIEQPMAVTEVDLAGDAVHDRLLTPTDGCEQADSLGILPHAPPSGESADRQSAGRPHGSGTGDQVSAPSKLTRLRPGRRRGDRQLILSAQSGAVDSFALGPYRIATRKGVNPHLGGSPRDPRAVVAHGAVRLCGGL